MVEGRILNVHNVSEVTRLLLVLSEAAWMLIILKEDLAVSKSYTAVYLLIGHCCGCFQICD